MKACALALALIASPALAQQQPPVSPGARFEVPPAPGATYAPPPAAPGFVEEPIEEERPAWRSEARAVAILRGLDKMAGRASDIRAPVGEEVTYGRLRLQVVECREPPEGEVADAFVFLRIWDSGEGGEALFSGWMFASSPALSAMDHQRYDIWPLSCATS
ncbi:MAG: DUF2155 domain-containing protein [Pikeienuella sp.]